MDPYKIFFQLKQKEAKKMGAKKKQKINAMNRKQLKTS